jgi:hypothetical protein
MKSTTNNKDSFQQACVEKQAGFVGTTLQPMRLPKWSGPLVEALR